MFTYTLKQASIIYRWTFDKMIPSLPTPGTQAFAELCKKLKPYGIAPSGISLEAPTSWMSDVSFRILLLDERATLRFSYGWFELSVNHLSQEDVDAITGIISSVLFALKELDKDSDIGNAQMIWNAHLSLSSTEVSDFLARYLSHHNQEPTLTPDAFAYKLKLNHSTESREPRVVVTSSAVFENSIFVNFSITYLALSDPNQISEQFTKDIESMLKLLELELSSSAKGDD